MIYDAFPFFNELELLELRLHELNEVVDRFVLAEATRTFTNQPKPSYFLQNRSAFAAFEHKLIHVLIEDMPGGNNPWVREDFQRNALSRGLTGCKPDDVVMVSDVDEIPSAASVRQAIASLPYQDAPGTRLLHWALKQRPATMLLRKWFKKNHPFVRVMDQRMHMYHLNCAARPPARWTGTRMTYYRDLSTPNDLRRWKGRRIPNAGWHFSYMGGVDRVQTKLAAFSHQEFNVPEVASREALAQTLDRGHNFIVPAERQYPMELDDSFPAYLLRNRKRFEHWLQPTQ